MSDILYRPDLSYEKDYDSSKSFISGSTDTDTATPSSPPASSPLDTVKENLDTIGKVINALPTDLANLIKKPLTGVEDIIDKVDPGTYDPDYNPSDEVVIVSPGDGSDPSTGGGGGSSDSDSDDDIPEDVFSDDIPFVSVQVIKTDVAEKIQKSYDKDIVSILADYTTNLKNKITGYLTNLSVIAMESGINNTSSLSKPYSTVTTTIQNKNLYHMADQIIRSQIVRDQKMRLFKKMYSPDQTISHVRSCKVSRDLRDRYYAESSVESKSFLDVSQNMMLEATRKAYDQKHHQNLVNLYKYLNSSVILMDECLSMAIQEAQAKAILIKTEGMKL